MIQFVSWGGGYLAMLKKASSTLCVKWSSHPLQGRKNPLRLQDQPHEDWKLYIYSNLYFSSATARLNHCQEKRKKRLMVFLPCRSKVIYVFLLSTASTSSILREERINPGWMPGPRKTGSYQSSKKSHGLQYQYNASCGGFCFCGNGFLVLLLPKLGEFISLTANIPERQEIESGKVSYFNFYEIFCKSHLLPRATLLLWEHYIISNWLYGSTPLPRLLAAIAWNQALLYESSGYLVVLGRTNLMWNFLAKVMGKFSHVNAFGALRSPVDFTLYGELQVNCDPGSHAWWVGAQQYDNGSVSITKPSVL